MLRFRGLGVPPEFSAEPLRGIARARCAGRPSHENCYMPLLIDAVIILAYFALIVWIGLSMGRRENTLHDFALGGRRVPWWAVMASIIAAGTSAATYLGTPGEGYA